jgi:hypothetical protein
MCLSSRGKWLLDQGLGFCWNLRIFFLKFGYKCHAPPGQQEA